MLIYAPVAPIGLCLAGWWASLLFTLDVSFNVVAAGSGLLCGIVLDVLLRRTWLCLSYRRSPMILGVIYLFYAVGLFGFFMGVPVGVVALGLLAGIYAARRAVVLRCSAVEALAWLRHTAWFCVAVLFVACAASAYLAVTDPYTPQNLQGMLGLSFEVTETMVHGLIGVGGAALLTVQYWLVICIGRWTLRQAAHCRQLDLAGQRRLQGSIRR